VPLSAYWTQADSREGVHIRVQATLGVAHRRSRKTKFEKGAK
jgi:hypothetical protein